MGEVLPLFAKEADVDAAWERYAEKARDLRADPDLRTDRRFMEELVRRYEVWKDLFVKQEASA